MRGTICGIENVRFFIFFPKKQCKQHAAAADGWGEYWSSISCSHDIHERIVWFSPNATATQSAEENTSASFQITSKVVENTRESHLHQYSEMLLRFFYPKRSGWQMEKTKKKVSKGDFFFLRWSVLHCIWSLSYITASKYLHFPSLSSIFHLVFSPFCLLNHCYTSPHQCL